LPAAHVSPPRPVHLTLSVSPFPVAGGKGRNRRGNAGAAVEEQAGDAATPAPATTEEQEQASRRPSSPFSSLHPSHTFSSAVRCAWVPPDGLGRPRARRPLLVGPQRVAVAAFSGALAILTGAVADATAITGGEGAPLALELSSPCHPRTIPLPSPRCLQPNSWVPSPPRLNPLLDRRRLVLTGSSVSRVTKKKCYSKVRCRLGLGLPQCSK